jgi:hypothetical protein
MTTRHVLSYKLKDCVVTENKITGAAEIIFLRSVARLLDQKKSKYIKNKSQKNSELHK